MNSGAWYNGPSLLDSSRRAVPKAEGMVSILGLEAIGDSVRTHPAAMRAAMLRPGLYHDVRMHLLLEDRKPWVARILGRCPRFGLQREFLTGKKDYSRANRVGSRGVYLYYTLHEGHVYDVHELVSWGCDRRYFVRAEAGAVVEMPKEEVDAWLAK